MVNLADDVEGYLIFEDDPSVPPKTTDDAIRWIVYCAIFDLIVKHEDELFSLLSALPDEVAIDHWVDSYVDRWADNRATRR